MLLRFHKAFWGICLALSPLALKATTDIQIDAKGKIDYYDDKNLYIAYGHVHIVRGSEHLWGDEVHVRFRRNGHHRRLTSLEAKGNARLNSPQGELSAPHLLYDIPTETLRACGPDIQLKTPSYTLCAQDSMMYCRASHKGDAKGAVHFVQEGKELTADNLFLTFKQKTESANDTSSPLPSKPSALLGSSENKVGIQTITATGHVSLFSDEQRGWANKASYDVEREWAELHGNVRLSRGEDFAMGDIGWMNLKEKKMGLKAKCRKTVQLLLHPKNLKKGK